MPGVRLFAALPLPEPVAEHLDAAVRSVETTASSGRGNARPVVRWVPQEQRHITLAFFGEIPAGAVEDLTAELHTTLGAMETLQLRLRGAGVFTGRVLWAGVQDLGQGEHSSASGPLIDVMAACERTGARYSASARAGERDRRRAHVTLARARDRRRGEEQLRTSAEALAVYEGPVWHAAQAELVLSELGQGRSGSPLYTTLAEVPLGPGA